MIYSSNRRSFKKGSVCVQHKQAHKRIVTQVKQYIGREGSFQTPNEQIENKCTNSQKPETDVNPFSKESKQHMLCQSVLEQTQKKRKATSKSYTIEHVIDYSIKSIDNSSKAARAQRQYITLLESKIEQLEKDLKSEKENKIVDKQSEENRKQELEYEKLIRFYHRARNIIVLQSVELLECKNILSQSKPNEGRVKSINSCMAKSEELLEVYRRGIENGSPRKQSCELDRIMEVAELKDLCVYQEKTIEFLRKQAQPSGQFNEVKLLRHEINRVCAENETLLQKVSKISKAEPKERSNNTPPRQNKEEQKRILGELAEKQNNIQKLQIEVDELRMHLLEQSNKLFTLEEEKKCAMEMAESATERNQELQQNIVELEIIIDKHEAEIHELKMSSVKTASKIVIQNYDIATTEELLKELKPYPRYEKLLFSIINQYETKISELRTQVCSERELKEKYKQWASEVYHLMESANIPPDLLQKHMNELYAFNDKMDCSKIEKFLRQIRAFSIGIDEKDVREMEAELEQYIVSLKSRNQVIKEADCEDGSSVAVSDTFTDQEFDEQ